MNNDLVNKLNVCQVDMFIRLQWIIEALKDGVIVS